MASHNAYAAYKRDTRHLLQWMITTSNTIIRQLIAHGSPDDIFLAPNSTGQVTVAELVAISQLISQHLADVPSTIYRLLRSVIRARTETYNFFLQMAIGSADATLHRQNSTHKHFIDALEGVFSNLGGKSWCEADDFGDQSDSGSGEQSLPTNRFESLHVDGDEEEDIEHLHHSEAHEKTHPRKYRRPKKSNGKKRGKTKKSQAGANRAYTPPDTLPLESYRIIEDTQGTVTEFLVAVYDAVSEFATVRASVQSVWHDVAHDKENAAVAGAVSHAAISMVKRTASGLFSDFPGHDSYETIINTIARGKNIDDMPEFSVSLHSISSDQAATKSGSAILDIKEQLSVYAYYDLRDFIVDYRKTGSGKPTKRMLSQIAKWDPSIDLQQLSQEQRIRWRRSYTINWLYELVNVYLTFSVTKHCRCQDPSHGNPGTGMREKYWHLPLFGLNEFAAFVSSLATEKSGAADISKKILPHHIFQLQCIVDSMAVSHGWSVRAFDGDVVTSSPEGFRACRDIDRFLGRGTKTGRGFLAACRTVQAMLNTEPAKTKPVTMEDLLYKELDLVCSILAKYLGTTKSLRRLNASMPPSRFADTNPNGLWEYSPFLCGTGLLEGLEMAYMAAMVVWDQMAGFLFFLHLYNKLFVEKRVEAQNPLRLIITAFAKEIFVSGIIPNSQYWDHAMERRHYWKACKKHAPKLLPVAISCSLESRNSNSNIYHLLDPALNHFFTRKVFTHHLRAANWEVERISSRDLEPPSLVALSRVCKLNPECKNQEDLDLMVRMFMCGGDNTGAALLRLVAEWRALLGADGTSLVTESGMDLAGWLKKMGHRGQRHAAGVSCDQILRLIRRDVSHDINSPASLLSINLVHVAVAVRIWLCSIVEKLKELGNPLYKLAGGGSLMPDSGVHRELLFLALERNDEECLQLFAQAIEKIGNTSFRYWEPTQDGPPEYPDTRTDKERCPVM